MKYAVQAIPGSHGLRQTDGVVRMSLDTTTPECRVCGTAFAPARWAIGKRTCLPCGERAARAVRHTIVPLPKSNYIVVTDRSLLLGLNSSHRGNR